MPNPFPKEFRDDVIRVAENRDPEATIAILPVAVFVAVEVKALLVGQGMDPEREQVLRDFLRQRPEIAEVISVISLQLGDKVMLSVQARMREERDVAVLLRQITAVERAVKAQFPEVRWSFFEPEASRAE